MTSGVTLNAEEAAVVLEENRNQALWICRLWVLPTQTLSSDFLEDHVLDEQVKLVKKMGDT